MRVCVFVISVRVYGICVRVCAASGESSLAIAESEVLSSFAAAFVYKGATIRIKKL